MENFTDKELLEKFRNPETRNYAYNMLVRQYQERLYHHIRRMVIAHDDANDVLQNVLLNVWKNLDRFEGKAQLFTWLYRIATNECINFLRQQKKRKTLSLDEEESGLAGQLKADDYFEGDAIQIKLLQAINSLPDKQKAVFNLRYHEEMSYEEMSEVMGTSVGALKASFHHAVKKIELFLKGD